MRDLVAREAEYGRAMLADLTARPAMPLAEPADGLSAGPATFVWSGGRKAPAGPAQSLGTLNEIAWADAWTDLDAIYAAAARVMAEAERMPIVGSEAWVESDEEYRARLAEMHPLLDLLLLPSRGLDNIGAISDLPRARLVRTER